MKKILGWMFVALLIAGIASATVVKDSMTYTSVVTFIGGLVNTGALTQTGAVTAVGDIGVTGNIDVTGSYISDTYHYDSSSGVSPSFTSGGLTWDKDYGNYLIASGTTPMYVTLPAITADMTGYTFTVKNSGVTIVNIDAYGAVASNGDYIEATRGTLTGTSDATIDAEGDVKTWVAIYKDALAPTETESGVTSIWMLKDQDLS